MNKRELIKLLEEYPDETEIVLNLDNTYSYKPTDVEIVYIEPMNDTITNVFIETDKSSEGSILAVLIS